jgi:hypothetical protein
MQTLLFENRNANVRAYFIWGPYLKSDTVELAQVNTERFQAPNSVYLWTPTPQLAQELSSVLGLPSGRLGWDVYLMYGKGVLWDKKFPEPTFWQHQIGVVQGEPLNMQRFTAKLQELLRAK